MNPEENKIYRLLGMIFTLIGAGCCILFALITVLSGMPLFLIALYAGIPFLAIGAAFLMKVRKSEQTENEVVEMGYTVDAVITDIYQDLTITVNGRHPWVAEAAYDDPETLRYYTFKVNTGMQPLSRRAIGAKVTVFVDPLDFGRYAVDLDTIEYEEEEDLSQILKKEQDDSSLLKRR